MLDHSPLLFAFDIATPAMLAWLAAATAPILIHLWSRRQYRTMSFAAMEYLLAALKSSRRRMQFEHWLLLVLRTLLIVLIVVAVAEPFLNRVGFGFTAGERTHHVIVLDGSYSMDYRPTDKNRFERAKELAARIVEESSEGDAFTLVLISDPPRVIVGTPVFEPRDFLEEIDALAMPHTSADLPTAVARVEEILIAARRDNPRLKREEIYFLTDLGRVGWTNKSSESPGATTPELRERLSRLAESAALVVVDLGQSGAENLAVTDVRTVEPFATIGRNVEFVAEIKNFGRQSRERQSVELVIDSRRVKQEFIDLSPEGQASVGYSYRFVTPGDHSVEIRLQADALDVDNHRFLAVPVKPSIRVLCVDGRYSGEPLGGATGFLSVALWRGQTISGTATIRPEVVLDSAILELDLSRYDCVFLADVDQFTSSQARVLEAYLKSGGSLVFFLGDRVMGDRYNQELGGERPDRPRLLPARLESVVEKSQTRLDPLGYRHPIVQPFLHSERAGLLTTPVRKYFKLVLPKSSKAKTVLALANGSPLIVEEPIHRGRVVLVATSADTTWTPMPLWPSFVPVVQEILIHSIGRQLEARNVRVGESIGATLASTAVDVPLTVLSPDGRSEPVRLRTEGDDSEWSFSETLTSGIYSARFGPPVGRTDQFAANVDTVESDLTKLTAEELRDEVWPDIPFIYQTSWENVSEEPVSASVRSSGLAKWLLYAVLLLLFLETYFAWRFGNPMS